MPSGCIDDAVGRGGRSRVGLEQVGMRGVEQFWRRRTNDARLGALVPGDDGARRLPQESGHNASLRGQRYRTVLLPSGRAADPGKP